MLHSQASVNIEPWHEVGLAGLRVLQTLGNESCAPLGQQQELLDMLPTGMPKTLEVLSVTYFLLKLLHCQVSPLSRATAFHTQTHSPWTVFAPLLPLKGSAFWLKGDTKFTFLSISHHLLLTLQYCLNIPSPSFSPEHLSYYSSYL